MAATAPGVSLLSTPDMTRKGSPCLWALDSLLEVPDTPSHPAGEPWASSGLSAVVRRPDPRPCGGQFCGWCVGSLLHTPALQHAGSLIDAVYAGAIVRADQSPCLKSENFALVLDHLLCSIM